MAAYLIDPKLTSYEAAEVAGVKRNTMNIWRMQGRGPKFLKLGRSVRYAKSDLDAWLESRKASNTAEAMALV